VIASQYLTAAHEGGISVNCATEPLCFNLPFVVLSAYFAHAPLAHAIFRGTEVLALSAHALPRPVLDLGCGAGEFAAHAVSGVVDVGLDYCGDQLRKAEKIGKYGRVEEG
jgi:SAM-dependent methyltransferase